MDLNTLSPVKKGKAAEHMFIARCLLEGLDCYSAVSEDGKIDVMVGKHRCQVKVLSHANGNVSVRKAGCNSKSNVKVYQYTPEDVDYFAVVNLATGAIYVVPIEFVNRYSSTISEPALVDWQDRFDLLH